MPVNCTPMVIAPPADLAPIGNAVERHIEKEAIGNPSFERDLQFGAAFVLIAQRATDFRIRIPVMIDPPLSTRGRCSRWGSSDLFGIGFAGFAIGNTPDWRITNIELLVNRSSHIIGCELSAMHAGRVPAGQGKLCGSAQK